MCAAAAVVDGFAIEPFWIKTVHVRIVEPVKAPLRIAQISDLHTTGFGRREKKILAILAEEKPDLIVLTGDLIRSHTAPERVGDLLGRLQAPLGVFVVPGNWDHWVGGDREDRMIGTSGAATLVNRAVRVRDDVWLVGFDDALSGQPTLDPLADLPVDAFAIGLFHSPVWFDHVAAKLPLSLAGHTHGGQVRLPFWGPLILPPASGGYVSGWYEKLGSRMYVSRGIGTSVIAVRFDCRPELTILDVVPAGG